MRRNLPRLSEKQKSTAEHGRAYPKRRGLSKNLLSPLGISESYSYRKNTAHCQYLRCKGITVTLVDGEYVVFFTLVKGNDITYSLDAGYVWSLAADQFVSVDFTTLTSDTTVYMIKQ